MGRRGGGGRLGAIAALLVAGACRGEVRWDQWGPYLPPAVAEALATAEAPPSRDFVAAFGRERPTLAAGHLVAVMHSLNRSNLLAADLAEVRAVRPATRRVAVMMRDHATVDGRRLDHAVGTLDLHPLPSALEARVRRLGDARVAGLAAVPLAGFDLAFLDDAVAAHERAAELLEWWLIPAAQPLALRALLGELRHWNGVRLRAARDARDLLGASA